MGYATALLDLWVRQRKVLSLEKAVHKLTQVPARVFGIPNRGVLAEGKVADLVLFDPDTVTAKTPKYAYDLPCNGRRLVSESEGIKATFVSGIQLYRRRQAHGRDARPHPAQLREIGAVMTRASERIAYHNGHFVPEREVLVPFRDRGFKYGDAVFDTTRTFGHRVFKLREHVERLYRSLRYLRIDPGLTPATMVEITEEVLRRNLSLLEPDDDYWVTQRVSRGLDGARPVRSGRRPAPTVIVECVPLPLRDRAPLYRDGIRVLMPSVRRTPPEALSPRVKTHNYLNMVAADLEVAVARSRGVGGSARHARQSGRRARQQHLPRSQGTLYTPREQFVLPGISRDTVIALAREAGFTVVEKDLDLFDAYNADEVFLTSTSLCVCPVRASTGRHRVGGCRAR